MKAIYTLRMLAILWAGMTAADANTAYALASSTTTTCSVPT